MRRALELAATPGVPLGPNPRVGCVLLDAGGATLATGYHRGAGTPHAEADALSRAGAAARGATAVVTLEPCNHAGRTGPCVDELLAAGVARVVFAQSDPNPVAAGGAARLAEHGVEVVPGLLADESAALNEAWTFAVGRGRPMVTWKVASTLDGRVAAADGSSRWVTGRGSRRGPRAARRGRCGPHRHRDRAGRRSQPDGPRPRRSSPAPSAPARRHGSAGDPGDRRPA